MEFVDFVLENTPTKGKFRVSERQAGKTMAKTKTKKGRTTTVNYPAGDFLIRLKNSALAGNKEFNVAATKLILAICKTLVKMGIIEDFKNSDGNITVKLAFKSKKPVILDARLVSKPGLRVYKGADELSKIKKPSALLVSTPKGIMSSKEAIKQRLGGEVIAEIW